MYAWWCHQMETFFALFVPLWGESTGHRWIPLTKASDADFGLFFDRRLNKRLSKQSKRRWFEAPSRSLWRHCNGSVLWFPENKHGHSVAAAPHEHHHHSNHRQPDCFSITYAGFQFQTANISSLRIADALWGKPQVNMDSPHKESVNAKSVAMSWRLLVL